MMRIVPAILLVTLSVPRVFAQNQNFDPPATFMPDAATLKAIDEKRQALNVAIERLRKSDEFKPINRGALADNFHWDPMVLVFAKAADWAVRHNEFLQKDSEKQTLAVLDEGLRRANDFPKFLASLHDLGGRSLACGYRSKIDDSVQPYVVTFPLNYGKDPKKKWRLDIVLHGRDNSLTEVKMLAEALKRRPAKAEQDYVQIEVFGRGNNAYRWAGEVDVREAMLAAIDLISVTNNGKSGGVVDEDRVVLRGFSMGGAGAWHIGLHRPSDWCVIGPGAGFTSTHGYINKLPAKLPSYQEACLHIYDAVDYAANARMVPVVAYAGDKDPQQQAAINIEAQLKPLGIPMTRLVGSGLAHQFPPEWQKKAQEAYAPFVQRGRRVDSKELHFVTYTLSYPYCDWIVLLELEQHYSRAEVDAIVTADGYDIRTKNVRAFRVQTHSTHAKKPKLVFQIDRQTVVSSLPKPEERPDTILSKDEGLWKERTWETNRSWMKVGEELKYVGEGNGNSPRKDIFWHGPIDDAFKKAFVCVRGSGKCASPQVQAYTDAALGQFRREWEIYFRGDLPVVTDKEFLEEVTKLARKTSQQWTTEDLIIRRSLILFGDPTSNAVIERLLKTHQQQLPLEWNAEAIVFGGQTFPADSHVPVFIYPNPSWPSRYIVVNSGHTFHEADFKGTNALLYPRLGDFAILKPTPTAKDPAAVEVVRAGLFDEMWHVPAEK
jgi:predicted esterase